MRPVMLDLFCCAGGAAAGYVAAGFDVIGFDKDPHPNYPYEFHQLDLVNPRTGEIEVPEYFVRRAVAGHGSPPCQSYSDLAKRNGNGHKWPRLIHPTRQFFRRLGIPYVIENVEGAESEMYDPITLCGTMFDGLRVLRHRLFETNWRLIAPPHPWPHPLVFTHDKRKAHYGRLDQNTSYVQVTGGGNCTIANAKAAMGITWMSKPELNEAIPPAYTEYIGTHLLKELR